LVRLRTNLRALDAGVPPLLKALVSSDTLLKFEDVHRTTETQAFYEAALRGPWRER
jgi:hypothetical protein